MYQISTLACAELLVLACAGWPRTSSPVAGHVSREMAPHQPQLPKKFPNIKVGLDMFTDNFRVTFVVIGSVTFFFSFARDIAL